MRNRFVFLIIVTLLLSLFFVPKMVLAQEIIDETLEGQVTKIVEDRQLTPAGSTEKQYFQKLEIDVTYGSLKGKTVSVDTGEIASTNNVQYKVGEKLVLNFNRDEAGKESFIITDYVRRGGLLILFIVFVVIAVVIGKWYGITSLAGMAITFFVIFEYLLPRISTGGDPVTVSIISCSFMVPLTFYLSHGINKKTTVAIIGTLISLVITGLLATFFAGITKLTGLSSEEAGFLQSFYPGTINIKGLLLAGIIIGGLGIFDDITVSQSAIVAELKNSLPKASFRDLYFKAMNIGHDHIASMINTLVLVYAGASLPLLLLFVKSPQPFQIVINYEFMAEEIVRTLVASIGLVLAVPITTFLAALAYKRSK